MAKLLLSAALFCTGAAASLGAVSEHHKYCIVGAGPAGVQLGHYLHLAGRDYITLDRAPKAASWFSKFPIHRQLNSINRRYTRCAFAKLHEHFCINRAHMQAKSFSIRFHNCNFPIFKGKQPLRHLNGHAAQ